MSISEETISDVVCATLQSDNPRLNEVMASLIHHLHGFIREVEPSDAEWMQGIQFLTEVGQLCDDKRQEYILLSDTLGVTALKDCINNRKPDGATEATVLGPFYRDGAAEMPLGSTISRGEHDGEACAVRGRVTDLNGKPLAGALLDVWQNAATGFYESQDDSQPEMNLRGRFRTDNKGYYYFRTVKPKSYPIPGDGPVGQLLSELGRHNFRPAHMHVIISAEGYEPVVTQFFDKEDEYIQSDAVFGVKDSLIVDFKKIDKPELAEELGLAVDDWLIEFDFVLSPTS